MRGMDDLLTEVREGLKARRGDWTRIAADLAPDVSYSWISQVGAGNYKSEPSYRRLQIVRTYLLTGKTPRAVA
jgi:hypothetical protein